MARNRSGTGEVVSESSAAAVTTKAEPAPASEPAARARQADVKLGADGSGATRVETPPPTAPVVKQAEKPPAKPSEVLVHIEVIRGGITNVKVPVAIVGQYQGLALAGPAKAFDRLLDSWLTRALDLGMIGLRLGRIFPVNLQRRREAGQINVDHLLLMGTGEPGHFAADDLRYLMANATVAVKSLRQQQLSTPLLGTRRAEIPIEAAVRGFLMGILDGYESFRGIADAVTDNRDGYREVAEQPLFVAVVESDEDKSRQIQEAFESVSKERSIPGLQLEVARGDNVDPDPVPEPSAPDTDPEVRVSLLRVTRNAADPPAAPPANPSPIGTAATEVFQYSALSEVAAVTVREVEVNSYLVRELPDRLTSASSLQEREAFGTFFSNYLIPDEFRKLTEGDGSLTLVVDESTAAYPWEMAAYKKHSRTIFLGASMGLSRQFRTLLSPPPGSPPPLNRVLKVLIIADPGPGNLSLPHARQEGLVVVDVLDHARKAWEGEYQFKVAVRIGSHQIEEDPALEKVRQLGGWIDSAESCDPLKLALLIVNEQFDVIHYAGHGAFDRKARWAGWVFDRDCFLSAQEIFRVRQVPRLVFANACFSAVTVNHNEQRGQLVGLAQAFFARGIPNYIGTGWQVDDDCAQECARWFYTRVLGLRRPADGESIIGTAPPATIGDSLLEARRAAFKFNQSSSTWGAYQHYGRVSDKPWRFPMSGKRQAGKGTGRG